MRTTWIAALALAALAADAAVAQDKDLAASCEAVKWVLPKPVDGVIVDPVPEGLASIRDELKARGPAAMDDVERCLDRSLHLRRIASDVVSTWPCDRSRRLLLRLVKDPDADTASWAAFGLGRVGGAEVVDALVAALADPRPRVRHDALNALGDVGGANKALDGAIACLAARESWVRHSAAQILSFADSGVERALPALEQMAAKEPEPGARAAAETSLRICRARLGR
jgi:hypothetical protein